MKRLPLTAHSIPERATYTDVYRLHAMTTQLQSYVAAYRQSSEEMHRLADPLSGEEFNWKPDAESWSIGECTEHLNLVAEVYLPRLEAATGKDKPRAEGPFTYGFIARKMIEGMRPDGPALSTSRALNPSTGSARSEIDKTQALRTFDECTERYIAICERAEGLDLARIKVRYPFFWLLRLPLGATIEITGLHALRHVRQAVRVSEKPDFPLSTEQRPT